MKTPALWPGFFKERTAAKDQARTGYEKLGSLRGDFALDFLEAGSLAAESADVIELGAAHFVAANLLDAVNDPGVEGEDALDALSEAHLADGECALGAIVDGDDEAFKSLQTFLVAFFNLDLDANLVSGDELGQIGALELFGQTLHNWMDRHGFFLRLNSELLV